MPNYPMIAVVGRSGSGKSTSLSKLPSNRTKILNIERKFLPFKSALELGKNDEWLKNSVEVDAAIIKAATDLSYDILVLESLTAYSDSLLTLCKSIKSGYEIYSFYAAKMTNLIDKLKALENKWVVVLGIDDLIALDNPNGTKSFIRRIAVNGKEIEKKSIDKEFTIVLFTDVVQAEDKTKFSSYKFLTSSDGTTTAKCPAGMFSTMQIPNDVFAVIQACESYYKFPTKVGYTI